MARITRSLVAHYLDSTPDETAATYELFGDGISDLTMNYNPNVSTETFVDDDTANIQVESYAPTIPVEQIVWSGDDLFDYIDSLRQAGPATLADAETYIVEVRLYETPDTPATSYPATRWPCSIQIDNGPGGPGGESARIGFTINVTGDAVDGDFNTSTLAFTATA